MRRPLRKILLLTIALLSAVTVSGQKKNRSDSLVTLISAQSAQLLEENGYHYRKVIGPARFFHNDTYLLCDTALWNIDTRIIKAYGHVKLIQDQTTLSSETADYVIDEDMAKFRGGLVQLEDKDKNLLRTRYLDYNTKDSVAIFQSGGSMRDKDGQIIESRYGSYEAKEKKFTFMDNVNMYTDSVFVKTSRLVYRSDESTAYFGYATDAWKDDGMLSADDGYYKRDLELFFFRKRVHIMNDKQEGWSDSLFYDKGLFTVEMLGNAEVMDTTRNAYGLAGRIEYIDSLSRVHMTRDPAVMTVTEKEGKRDTLYIGADTLIFLSKKRCDFAEGEVKAAETRLNDLAGDPVAEYRRKAAEAAAKAAEEAAANDPNRPPEPPGKKGAPAKAEEPAAPVIPSPEGASVSPSDSTAITPSDSLAVIPSPDSTAVIPSPEGASVSPSDSTDILSASGLGMPPADSLVAPSDTLAAPADSVVVPPDTTKIDIAYAISRVKMFKEDTQFVCDSLVYTALDSLYRLYIDPIVYNEGNRQYVADSIFVATKNGAIDKASLMSNAFVTTEEEPDLYDQIRGAEVLAYFDSTGALKRFDGLGGANAIFYLEENGALATVNKVESKMLCALFKEGQVERIFYFDEAKNDAYPIVQLPKEERQLKGFRWDPEKRPKGREDVTPLVPRESERKEYASHERPEFKETAVYFPGHMAAIYKEMEKRDSLEAAAARRRAEAAREAPPESVDSLSFDTLKDSLSAISDSLTFAADSLAASGDSLSVNSGDSSVISSDSSVISSGAEKSQADSTGKVQVPTKEELKALQKAERERKKAEREAALEAKWAEKDRIDAEKAAAKAEKAKAKKRKRNLKFLQKQQKQEERDTRLLERYKERYQKRQERKKK